METDPPLSPRGRFVYKSTPSFQFEPPTRDYKLHVNVWNDLVSDNADAKEYENPKAIVFFFHGLHDHSGRFSTFARLLNAIDIAAFGLDFYGHGRSDGNRGYWESIDEIANDAIAFIQAVLSSYRLAGSIPLFVVGEGIGGLIGINCSKAVAALTGLILLNPALKIVDSYSKTRVVVGKLVGKVTPHHRVVSLKVHKYSHDKAEQKAFLDDPLRISSGVKAKTGMQILAALQAMPKMFHAVTCPLIILQGGADEVIDPDGPVELFEKSSSTDKFIKVYPGLYHDLLHEREEDRKEVYADILEWIEVRVVSPASPATTPEHT